MKKDKYNNTPDLHDFLHRLEEKNELIKIKKFNYKNPRRK